MTPQHRLEPPEGGPGRTAVRSARLSTDPLFARNLQFRVETSATSRSVTASESTVTELPAGAKAAIPERRVLRLSDCLPTPERGAE